MNKKDPSTPLYLQIAEDIRTKIVNEEYVPDKRLPFESWFMKYYDVSRVTVRNALDELVHQGILERRRHQGLYVPQS